MTDKTLSGMANPFSFGGPVVNGLFKWTDSVAAVKNEGVRLKADGPPIEVGAVSAANQAVIGVVFSGLICSQHAIKLIFESKEVKFRVDSNNFIEEMR